MHARLVRLPRGPSILAVLLAVAICSGLGSPVKATSSFLPAVSSSTDSPSTDSPSTGSLRSGSPPPGSPRPGLLILDEPPQPLVEKRPRSEADEDRVEAIALFAAGRMLERQLRHAEALRHYQRALRYDPEAVSVARAIIPLAFRLKRHAEAVRYALKAVELEEPDPLLLQRLGAYLIEIGDFQGAVRLYEKAATARHREKQTADDVRLRMEMGRLYHLLEKYGKAADCFARVRDALDDPEKFGIDEKMKALLLSQPAVTYNLFGECFLRADRTEEALAAFEEAHRLAPNQGAWQFHRAQVHAHRNQPEKALADLQVCFKEHLATEGTAPYKLLAEMLEDLGREDELIPLLETAHGDDPKNVPLGYFLAESYLKAEKFPKAELFYRALINKTPTLTGYRRLIELYRKTKRPDPLLQILGEVVEKTEMLEALGAEAKAVAADGELMGSLIETARGKLAADPKQLDYGMRLAVGLLALEGRQFEAAGEFFDLALQTKSDQAAELLLIWGMGLLLEDRFPEAAKVFQRAIDEQALPDDNPAFYYYLAGALAMNEQPEKALAAARKAAEVEPDSPRFRARVAWVLYRAKRHDEAIAAYRELVDEFDADHRSAETRQVLRDARFALSNLYVIEEDYEQAEEWLEQVLDEFPDDVGASNDLGYLWADQGKRLGRALKMIQHAVDAEPENVAYRDSLGWIYYRLGKYQQAVVELQTAIQQQKKAGHEEPDPLILDHLGDARLKVNQPEKAKDAWRRAVKLFQKQEEPEKVKQVQKKIELNDKTQMTDDE